MAGLAGLAASMGTAGASAGVGAGAGSGIGGLLGSMASGTDNIYKAATSGMDEEGKATFDSVANSAIQKGGKNRDKGEQWGQAKDMSQYSNMGNLLQLSNAMSKPSGKEKIGNQLTSEYLVSLLGG